MHRRNMSDTAYGILATGKPTPHSSVIEAPSSRPHWEPGVALQTGQIQVQTPVVPADYYGHPLFYKIVEELKQLHSEKNRQYATKGNPLSNFERCGKMISKLLKPGVNPTLASCLALVAKQIDGVYELVGEQKKNTFDSLDDKLKDIAVYAVIAMIINRESVAT